VLVRFPSRLFSIAFPPVFQTFSVSFLPRCWPVPALVPERVVMLLAERETGSMKLPFTKQGVDEMSQESRKTNTQGRVVESDLRVGLNLLGEHGRMLLAQYIKTKSQLREKTPATEIQLPQRLHLTS
jgi:hypothetical protein